MKKRAFIFIGILLLAAVLFAVVGRVLDMKINNETETPETETMVVLPETSETPSETYEESTSETGPAATTTVPHEYEHLQPGEYVIEETKEVNPELQITFDYSQIADRKARLPFEVSYNDLISVSRWEFSQLELTKAEVSVSPVFDYDEELRSYYYLIKVNDDIEFILCYNVSYRAWSYQEV